MNLDIYEIRDFIQTYGLLLQITALIVYLVYRSKVSAFMYVVLVVIIATIFQLIFEKELMILSQNIEYQNIVYNVWYLGFAYTDALIVIVAIYLCHKNNHELDSASRMILISYFALGLIQVARYIDRIMIESDVLGAAYTVAIPTINVAVTFLICGHVVQVCMQKKPAF